MTPSPDPQLVYSRAYNLGTPALARLHPFDIRKYGRAVRRLREQGDRLRGRLHRPPRLTAELLHSVHPPEYLARLREPAYLARALEVPQLAHMPAAVLDRLVLRPMRAATAGTVLATELALRHGAAINLSGGYHHASADRGEGFCVYADAAIAIRHARRAAGVKRVLCIDLDAHQGNGVSRIFAGDPDAAVYDVYNRSIYPNDREAIGALRYGHPIEPGTGGAAYLDLLRRTLPGVLDAERPELAIYNAGTDILEDDPLGGLSVPYESVLERDRIVFQELSARGIPWVMVTSGGYTQASHRLIADSVAFVLRTWG